MAAPVPRARKSNPSRTVITPWQPGIPVPWSLAAIKAATRQLMHGHFDRAALLVRSMGEDDSIPGAMATLVQSVLKAPFSIEPYDSDTQDDPVADAADDLSRCMFPDAELAPFIADKVLLGVGLGVLDWVTDDPRGWYPKFRRLDPEHLWYDSGRRVWQYNAREGLQTVEPGNGTWVLWVDGEYGWFQALMRALALLWWFKNTTFRDWNRYNERHGLPIIKAHMPMEGEDNEKDKFVEDVRELGSEGVVGLPRTTDEWSSFDLQLLEPTDQSWDSFQATIDRADRKIDILILGSNIGTEQTAATGGARAAAQESNAKVDRIRAKTLAQGLGECLQKQMLAPWVALNYGAGNMPPYPCWKTDPPEDKQLSAAAILSFGQALNALRTAGWDVSNIKELALPYGLELTKAPPPQNPVIQGAPGERVPPKQLSQTASAALLLADQGERDAVRGIAQTEVQADDIALAAAEVMGPDIRTLVRIVQSAQNLAGIEAGVRAAFSQANPSKLADLLEHAMVLAEVDGRISVKGD